MNHHHLVVMWYTTDLFLNTGCAVGSMMLLMRSVQVLTQGSVNTTSGRKRVFADLKMR
jgi:hypothetical protein